MSTNVSLNTRLKELRTKLGLTKTQMAEKLNISRVAYGNYENGSRTPDCNLICDFSIALNVTSDYLLGLSNTRNPKYAKISSTTGLNENAILYLSKIQNSSLQNNTLIVNLLLNDEPDISQFEAVLPIASNIAQKSIEDMGEKNLYEKEIFSKSVLTHLQSEWDYNDYVDNLSEKELFQQASKDYADWTEYYSNSISSTDFDHENSANSINEFLAYLDRESQKSNLLSTISDYLTYSEGCRLYTAEKEEALSANHNIKLLVGTNHLLEFPSKESDELFEFMLLQKTIEALKKFKENYLKLIEK